MRTHPVDQHADEPNEAPNHPFRTQIVGAHDDVIHVAPEASQHDQDHMHVEESKVEVHQNKMNRAGPLPPAERLCEPRKPVHQRGRHGSSGNNRQRRKRENDAEVGKLLQGIVAVESVGFRRKVERGVMNKGVPCLN